MGEYERLRCHKTLYWHISVDLPEKLTGVSRLFCFPRPFFHHHKCFFFFVIDRNFSFQRGKNIIMLNRVLASSCQLTLPSSSEDCTSSGTPTCLISPEHHSVSHVLHWLKTPWQPLFINSTQMNLALKSCRINLILSSPVMVDQALCKCSDVIVTAVGGDLS